MSPLKRVLRAPHASEGHLSTLDATIRGAWSVAGRPFPSTYGILPRGETTPCLMWRPAGCSFALTAMLLFFDLSNASCCPSKQLCERLESRQSVVFCHSRQTVGRHAWDTPEVGNDAAGERRPDMEAPDARERALRDKRYRLRYACTSPVQCVPLIGTVLNQSENCPCSALVRAIGKIAALTMCTRTSRCTGFWTHLKLAEKV